MLEIDRMIADFEAMVGRYEALIPISDGLARQTFLTHREFDLGIIRQLRQVRANAA